MITIRRGNVELDVNEDFIQSYLNEGYNIVDKQSGKVITRGIPNNFTDLKIAYMELEKHCKELEDKLKVYEESGSKKSKTKK